MRAGCRVDCFKKLCERCRSPGVTQRCVWSSWKIPRGAALGFLRQGEGALEETSVMGILRVEVKRNTDGLLVREKAVSVTDVKVSYFFAALQTCS